MSVNGKMLDLIDGDVLTEAIADAEFQIAHYEGLLKFGSSARTLLDFWTGRLSGLRSAKEMLR